MVETKEEKEEANSVGKAVATGNKLRITRRNAPKAKMKIANVIIVLYCEHHGTNTYPQRHTK